MADDNIIRGGLDIVTDKKKTINRRRSKKPPSLWLRGLKKPKADLETRPPTAVRLIKVAVVVVKYNRIVVAVVVVEYNRIVVAVVVKYNRIVVVVVACLALRNSIVVISMVELSHGLFR